MILKDNCSEFILWPFYIDFFLFGPLRGHDLHIHEVSISHSKTHHSWLDPSRRVISSSQWHLPGNTQHSQQTDIHASSGIRSHNPRKRAAADLRLRLRGHWDRYLRVYRLYYLQFTGMKSTGYAGMCCTNDVSWRCRRRNLKCQSNSNGPFRHVAWNHWPFSCRHGVKIRSYIRRQIWSINTVRYVCMYICMSWPDLQYSRRQRSAVRLRTFKTRRTSIASECSNRRRVGNEWTANWT